MKQYRFRPRDRIRKSAEFKNVYERARPVSDGVLRLYACENDLGHCRLGLAVGRRYGTAVVRNQYKRLFREAFRISRDQLPSSLDLVLIPGGAGVLSLPQICQSLVKLAHVAERRLKQIPRKPRTRSSGA